MFHATPGSTGRRAARHLVVTGAVAALTVGMAACGGSGGSGAPAAAKAPDASALTKAGGVTKVTVLARHGRHQRRGADQAGRRLQQGQRGQDPGRGHLRGQVRRRDRQVQGLGPEQVHPRRRAGLRHRDPLHDRCRAGRPDAGLHRPRQGRHERPAAEHRRLLLGGQEALLDAVQHLDAGAVHQPEALQGGRARPGQAADHPGGDPHRGGEAVQEERRAGRLRVRRRHLRLAARAVHRRERRGVLRPGQRPGRQGHQGQLRRRHQRRGRRLVAEDGQGRPGRQHRPRHEGGPGRLQVRPAGDDARVDRSGRGVPGGGQGRRLRPRCGQLPQAQAGQRAARSSAAPRCGSTAPATATPRRKPPGSS